MGSFLNCLIYRTETKKSFLRGRSFCPKCHHKLSFFDLIPVFSFFVLGGKCRYCHKKISWQYPLVEISTGLIFLQIFNSQFSILNFQNLINLCLLLLVSCFLILIFVYDLKHYIIPDKFIYPAIGAGLIFSFRNVNFYSSLLAGGGLAGFFFLIWLVSRGRWIGFGDVKLGFLIGLLVGFPNVFVALCSASFIGAIMGIGLTLKGKKTMKSQVPFGPFLVLGTFIALFWGREIINWYLSFATYSM